MLTTTTPPVGSAQKAAMAHKASKATCVLNTTGMQRYIARHVTPKTNMVINIMFHQPGTGWQ